MIQENYFFQCVLINSSWHLLCSVFLLLFLHHLLEHKNPSKCNWTLKLTTFKSPRTVTYVVSLLVKNIDLSEAVRDVLLDQTNLVVIVAVEHPVAWFDQFKFSVAFPQFSKLALINHGYISPHLHKLKTRRYGCFPIRVRFRQNWEGLRLLLCAKYC